jgi:hypothetical protein
MPGGCGWPAGADGRGVRMAGGLNARRTACVMHWSRAAGLHARLISDGAPSCPQAILRVLPTDKFARNPFHGGQSVSSCVSLRPSVRARCPDVPRFGLRRGGKLERGAGRAASSGEQSSTGRTGSDLRRCLGA